MNKTDRFDRWRLKWRNYLLGEAWNENFKESKAVISSLEKIADVNILELKKNNKNEIIFTSASYRLRALAMAYATPGTKYYGREAVKTEILEGMERLNQEEYNMDASPENWWAMEVGIPLRVLDILILMYEELPGQEEYIRRFTDIILHFQNAYELTSRGREETGANLMWKCHVHLLTGILRGEMHWIDWANEHLPLILQYSNKVQIPGAPNSHFDDGYYPDGSFIQHYYFSYTGGYGKNLLCILSGLMYAFDGEECLKLPEEKREFFFTMIHKAYEPLIYNGRFMDIARGREISRYYYQDYIAGRHCIRAICYLSKVMKGEEQKRTRSMLKEWLKANGTGETLFQDESIYAEYFVQPSLVEVLKEIEQDSVLPRGELIANYQFGPMCKAVHLGKGFGMAVSMYSPTIACYEYLNGESHKCWHVSDGVTYLYTADADQYNGNYYGCADMQRLPGTTVDRSPGRYTDPYYCWYLPESKNVYAFAGGTSLDAYGITGMQYRGQGNGKKRDLEVKKSWFMYDDAVVCLGSGITSTTGNPIETIIDNKQLLNDMSNRITMDILAFPCAAVSEELVCELQTLHLTGNAGAASDIGYYFPNMERVHVLCERREGTWNSAEVNPDHICDNPFAAYWIAHGKSPRDAGYAYVILPGRSAEGTRQYGDSGEVEILECTPSAHAVRNNRLNILGIHFWEEKPYTCGGISCDTQASIMLRRGASEAEISIADPAKSDAVINISFDFGIKIVRQVPKQVEVISCNPLRLRVHTKQLQGQSLLIKTEL